MDLERELGQKADNQQAQIIQEQFDIAMGYETQRDFQLAREIYQKLLGEDVSESQRFNIYKNMGNVYLKLSELNLAEGCYGKASVLFPKSPVLAVNLGVLEIQKGDLDKAKTHFLKALNLEPENDVAWVGLSLVHRAHSDHDLSRACVLRALDSNPVNKTALVHYYQWCRDDSVEASLTAINTYLETNPSDQEIRSLLMKYQEVTS